ncbi:MAG: CARDB domain-containing protein [Promethearchaeota archaeon]
MSIYKFKLRTPTIYFLGILSILMIGTLVSTQTNTFLGENKFYDEENQPIANSELYFAIFENHYPWEYSSIQEILDWNGIMYNVFNYTDVGIVDLLLYDKVIISSTSDGSDIVMTDAVIANRYWFEDYVQAGGILELHAATNTNWDGFLPGGYQYMYNESDDVNIVDVEHPIFYNPWNITDDELDGWGTSTHGYLENATLSTVLLESPFGPVLVEQILGNGVILASTQTLEHGYANGFSNFLENVLLYMGEGSVEFHDLSINIASLDFATIGNINPITMDVYNRGGFTEVDINITLYLDGVSVFSDYIPLIYGHHVNNYVYDWIPIQPGNYTFTAVISDVMNETTYANNLDTQVIHVAEPGENYMMEAIDFSWYDAYSSGANIWMVGDDTSYELNLPFTFNYYDQSFETVYISSNGWMSFTNTNPYEYSNPSFPSTDSSHDYAIAVFWDDLIANNNIYVWETTDFVVIEYQNYYHLGGNLAGTFEVILFATGEIIFQYQYIEYDDGATVGLNHGLNEEIFNEYMPSLGAISEFALKFSQDGMVFGNDVRMFLEPSPHMGIEMTQWVTMTVGNFGSFNETNVNVSLYKDGVDVSNDTIPLLLIGDNMSYTYEWTPHAYGIYNFTAIVDPVVNETRIFNNRMTRMVDIVNNSIPMEVGDLMMWRSFHDDWNEFVELEVVANISTTELRMNITTFDRETGAETIQQYSVNPLTRECAAFGGYFPYWINVDDLYIGKWIQITDVSFDGEVVGFESYNYNGIYRDSVIVQMNDNSRRIYDKSTGIYVGYEPNYEPNLELIYTNIFDDLLSHHNLYAHFSIVEENAYEDSVLVSAFIMNTGNYTETANIGIYLDGNALHTETFYNMNPGEYHFINMGRLYPTVIPTHGDALFTLVIEEVFDESDTQDNYDDNWVYMGENLIGTLRIYVYDSRDESALSGVEVKVDGISIAYSVTLYTDHNGEVYMENMPPGEFYVKISLEGYRYDSFYFDLYEYDPDHEFQIYLEYLFGDVQDDSDDENPFATLNIPGYNLGIFVFVIGISIVVLGKRKQK